MNRDAKKTALRLIENGVFVLTTQSGDALFGSTVTWVTQTSFDPPLVGVALRTDSGVYQAVRASRKFALHMLRKDQQSFAASFFRASIFDENTINEHRYTLSANGNPILHDTAAFVECRVEDILQRGDHHVVIGEVVEAGVRDATSSLALSDTGWSYGG
ncbi:MAG: flavin reductase family protein [Fidelibacterota bacterium]